MFVVQCPACQVRLSLDDALSGRRARCPKCRNVFRIPEPSPEEQIAFPPWLLALCVVVVLILAYLGLAILLGPGSAALIVGAIGGALLTFMQGRNMLNWLRARRQAAKALSASLPNAVPRTDAGGQAGPKPLVDIDDISEEHGHDWAEPADISEWLNETPSNDVIQASVNAKRNGITDPIPIGGTERPISTPRARSNQSRDGLVQIQAASSNRSGTSIPPVSSPKSISRSINRWISGPSREDVRFYGPGSTLRLEHTNVSAPLVYHVEGTLPAPFDASLIESGLPLTNSRGPAAELPYWPSYRDCSPVQRRNYLEWLTSGRSAPGVELGYVFIYFYGLERRALIDGRDHEAIFHEVLRLLSVYQSSNSFRRYATSLLWTILLTAPENSLPSSALMTVVRMTDRWSEENLAAMLSVYCTRNQPVPAEIAFVIARHDPRSPNSVVVRRHPEKFRELFEQRFRGQFVHGKQLRAARKAMHFQYRPASQTLMQDWYDHPLRTLKLPNVLGLSSQFRPLVEIWTSAVEDLREYDRAHRKAAGGTMSAEMYEALPSELRQDDHPEFDRWYAVLNRFTNADGWTLAPVSELAALRGIAQRKKLTRKQSESLLSAADAMDFCIEPDARETGLNYGWDERVSIFPREHEGATNLKSYHVASILLRLGMSVATADGSVDSREVAVITQQLERQFDLSPQDSTRLEHLAYVLTHTGEDATRVSRQLTDLPEPQRRTIGEFLVAVAATDEVVTSDEVRTLGKVYRILGLDPAELDTLAAGHVREAGAAQETADELILSHDRIREIMSETAKVAQFLQNIMLDDEDETTTSSVHRRNYEEPVVSTIARHDEAFDRQDTPASGAPATAAYPGLDTRYHAFLECLLTKSEWSRDMLDTAARDHRVMLGGAIETINEWSLEHRGDWLIEESEATIVVRSDLLDHSGADAPVAS